MFAILTLFDIVLLIPDSVIKKMEDLIPTLLEHLRVLTKYSLNWLSFMHLNLKSYSLRA